MEAIDRSDRYAHDGRMSTDAITGEFRWVPKEENGPSLPMGVDRLSAFAYVDPAEESAIFVRGVPEFGQAGTVEAVWCDGYPSPATRPGDVITLIASQRPIATIEVRD